MTGMERLTLSAEQWLELVRDHDITISAWITVVSNSMYPWIRANRDRVMLAPVEAEELKKGDIVLFPIQRMDADYCLHRIYRLEGDRAQTMGDANRRPDGWTSKGDIVGKAVLIQRGDMTIDCVSPKWVRRFRWWNRFWRIRPAMLSLLRAAIKYKRILCRE